MVARHHLSITMHSRLASPPLEVTSLPVAARIVLHGPEPALVGVSLGILLCRENILEKIFWILSGPTFQSVFTGLGGLRDTVYRDTVAILFEDFESHHVTVVPKLALSTHKISAQYQPALASGNCG